jgi:hypothetical protein
MACVSTKKLVSVCEALSSYALSASQPRGREVLFGQGISEGLPCERNHFFIAYLGLADSA